MLILNKIVKFKAVFLPSFEFFRTGVQPTARQFMGYLGTENEAEISLVRGGSEVLDSAPSFLRRNQMRDLRRN